MKRILPTLGAAVAGALLLASCSSGSLAASETTAPGSATVSAASTTGRPAITGPTLVVTVPELVLSSEGTAPVTVASTGDAAAAAPPSPTSSSPAAAPGPAPATTTADAEPDTNAPATPEPTTEPQAPGPASPGDGLNVSLANCDGCSVVATHRDVTSGRSAALVSTGSGRALLLSVGADGQVAGVIGVPYGAAFPAPADAVLPCAEGRCVVSGRQADGRAVLSAFELLDSGAWRDVSGDDAFPSATERSAVIDLDGELAIAVQDQAAGAAVWMLYTWGGDRFAVLGCAPDGDPPTTVAGVSAANCLS